MESDLDRFESLVYSEDLDIVCQWDEHIETMF